MTDDIKKTLADAVDAESGWPGAEMAPVAYRRWTSYSRRHKTKEPTTDDRINDLAKGLQAHFEPDVPYTHKSEWVHLAGVLAKLLLAKRT